MQNISLIHKLIFTIRILVSHERNGPIHFWPCHTISWICTSMQKISSFHQFVLGIHSILESHDQVSTPIIDDDDDDELFLWYGWPTKGV